MATSNHTPNYNLSQYAAGDPVKFLTNYNQDMAAIDTVLKEIHDSDVAKVPQSRTLAALPFTADVTLAQLIAAGLCPAPESGTWMPTIYGQTTAGSPTYTTQSGKYYKIGELVHLEFDIAVSALGGAAGQIIIGGQPFANQNEACGVIAYGSIDNSIGSLKLDMWHGFMFLRHGNYGNVVDTNASSFILVGCTIDYLTNS